MNSSALFVPATEESLQFKTWTWLGQNGRMVIPAAFRKAMGIQVGDEILLRVEDDELRSPLGSDVFVTPSVALGVSETGGLARRGTAFGATRGGQA